MVGDSFQSFLSGAVVFFAIALLLIISDPARCSYSGGARGVGGLTCGLELGLELSDRIGVKE